MTGSFPPSVACFPDRSRTPPRNAGNYTTSASALRKALRSGQRDAQADPRLSQIFYAWERLPEAIRSAVAALVRDAAATGTK